MSEDKDLMKHQVDPEPWWCDGLRDAVLDPECGILYSPYKRMYGLHNFINNRLPSEYAWISDNRPPFWTMDVFAFCPWCGVRLPRDLSRAWHDELLDLGVLDQEDHPLPEAYASDRWWRGRGLPGDVVFDTTSMQPGSCRDRMSNFGVMEHCPRMLGVVSDARSTFTYVARWREYGIRCFDQDRPVWSQPSRYRRIAWSPWCGRRLPGSLKAVWVSLLDIYGIVADMDHLPDANSIAGLPDAMLSDLWWRDRPDHYGDPRAGRDDLDAGHCRPPKDQLPDGDPRIATPATPGRRKKPAPHK